MRLSFILALVLALGLVSDQVGSLWCALTFDALIVGFAFWDYADRRSLYNSGYRYSKK